MAQSRTMKTPAKSKSNSQISISHTGMFSFLAAFVGVLAAVPITVAIVMPMVHQQLVSATSGLSRSVQLKTAADTLSCSQPGSVSAVTASSSGGGQVLGAATSLPTAGGTGGGSGAGGSTNTFVKKIVTGDFSGTATISNTGTDSTNNVSFTSTATTTIDNTNDISVSNSSSQSGSSGNANVSQNTTGGSAQSGDSSNTNSANFNITASN